MTAVAERVGSALENVPDESFRNDELIGLVEAYYVCEISVLGILVTCADKGIVGRRGRLVEPVKYCDDVFASSIVELPDKGSFCVVILPEV